MGFAWFAVVLTIAAFARAQSGSTTARCTYAEWTFNGKGQTACLVWAQLQSLCQTAAVSVGPITPSTAPYYPPSGANATDCNCNVVAYNLMGGCSWCQSGIHTTDWVSESQWSSSCTSYNQFGLPASVQSNVQTANVQIPNWALMTVRGGTWSVGLAEAAAEEDGDVTSATGGSVGGSGPTRTTTSGVRRPTGPLSGGDPRPSRDDDDRKTLIIIIASVLGVCLGLPAIASIIALIVFCVRQNKRQKFYGPLAEYYRNGGAPPPELMAQAAPMGAGGMMYAPQPQAGYYEQRPVSGYVVAPPPPASPWAGSSTAPATTGSASVVSSLPQSYASSGAPPQQQQFNEWNPFHQQQFGQGSPVSGIVQPNGAGVASSVPQQGPYVHGPQPGVPLV